MKKFILFIILTYLMFILTGCGKQIVTCEGNMSEDDINAIVKVTGIFKNSKLSEQTIKMDFDLTNYLQYVDIETFYESFKNQYEKFNAYEGINVEIEKNSSTIIVIMNIDLEKVDEETYSTLEIGNGNIEVSSKAFIDEFTDMGLTCK